jgi:phytoene dehydrogenase-like protein
MGERYDAVVVGSGPNGLSAAIEIARAGHSVVVLEAKEHVGGGARTIELTEPGFQHDVCSAIHPVGAISPFFRELGLERWGVEWIDPPVALAHPLDDGPAATLFQSIDETARSLGPDGEAYRDLVGPLAARGATLFPEILKPIRFPRHPFVMARFGLPALRSCDAVVRRFEGPQAKALFGGCAGHSMMPLDRLATASFGLVLLLSGHHVNWPLVRRGSQAIVDALVACLESHGGEIRTGHPVRSLDDLPDSRVVLFDLTAGQVARVAGDALTPRYRRKLETFRYGPGVFKVDWALSGPIPWRDDACRRAATVHVAGPYEELARGEAEVWEGKHPERPFVLVAQQSLFDATRAPEGKQTGWAYCHVPNGSTVDMTERIEQQIERFAPGFRDLVVARRTISAAGYSEYNENMVGGDIGGGANDLWQFMARPTARWNPYTTPNERLFICSSSTPPGGGVHGMCGYWAARAALKRLE